MGADEKPKCPECDTEIVMVKDGDKIVTPDTCAKCGFRLKGFTGFQRWLKAAMKEAKPKPTTKKDDDDDVLSSLREL